MLPRQNLTPLMIVSHSASAPGVNHVSPIRICVLRYKIRSISYALGGYHESPDREDRVVQAVYAYFDALGGNGFSPEKERHIQNRF